MTEPEKEEKPIEGASEEEEGGFFLESLSALDAVQDPEEDTSLSGRRSKPDSGIFSLDPNRAIRELRERQKRLEKLIAMLTGVIMLVVIGVAVVFQTNILDGAADRLSGRSTHTPVNCNSAADRDSEECQMRRRRQESTWSGIERSVNGKENHFSLHRK